jgi:thiamine monophosphate synthase
MKDPEIPLLTVVTSEKPVPDESKVLHALLAAGLECLWLRKPGLDVHALADIFEAISPAYRARVMIPFSLWRAHRVQDNISGVHFSTSEREALSYRELDLFSGQIARMSTPVHSREELLALPDMFSQVIVSPLFDSISKAGYPANKSLWEVPGVRPDIAKIGLGGIHAGNMCQVFRSGFEGVTLMGSIWQATDPLAAWKHIRRQTGHDSLSPFFR